MPDNLTPEDRKKTMRAVKGKGTRLERRLFSMLAGMGLSGWRQNADDLFGKPDVAFDRQKVAIFIDGCFWHGCPVCNRKRPETNRAYWDRKIDRNIELAVLNKQRLEESGWTVLRIWEHSMRKKEDRIFIGRQINQAVAANDRP
jgi:DNA mismatch endonuclease (patch repair protein)